jgi:hypothetical protein
MATLVELVTQQEIPLRQITEHLNSLSKEERVRQVVALNRQQQERLWDLAQQAPKSVTLDFLVPTDAPALLPFPFEGKNSLPVFTHFQKVFYRTSDGKIAGYNHQSLAWLTGPGYYVAKPAMGKPGAVVIDYTEIPSSRPPDWPPIRPNESGISRFVYAGMRDYLRWVSPDVAIGRAYKGEEERPTPNWFLLCRTQ